MPHLWVTSHGLLHRDLINSTLCVPPHSRTQDPGPHFTPLEPSAPAPATPQQTPALSLALPQHRPQTYCIGWDVEDLSPACLWPHLLLLLTGLSGHHWSWLGAVGGPCYQPAALPSVFTPVGLNPTSEGTASPRVTP